MLLERMVVAWLLSVEQFWRDAESTYQRNEFHRTEYTILNKSIINNLFFGEWFVFPKRLEPMN